MKLNSIFALLALGATTVVVAVPASAEDPKPEPMPCVGAQMSDPKGDVVVLPTGAAPDSMDFEQAFFRYVSVGDKKVLTANMQVKKLTKDRYNGAVGIEWEFRWKTPENSWTAGVRLDSQGALSYFSGSTFVDDAQGPTPPKTTGRFIEGDRGVIEIVVPEPARFAGKTLTNLVATATLKYTPVDRDGQESAPLDRAPDGTAFGTNFPVVECPVEATATATATATETASATATATPSATATATATAPPQQGGSPQQGGASPTATPVPVSKPTTTAKKKKLSCAKKAKKKFKGAKNKKKLKAALKKCKKAKKRR